MAFLLCMIVREILCVSARKTTALHLLMVLRGP